MPLYARGQLSTERVQKTTYELSRLTVLKL